MQASIPDKEKPEKDRKTILREKKTKEEKKEKNKSVDIRKTKEEEILREVTVKIGLERIYMQKGITIEVFVVATTRRNGTHSLLTSAKLSVGYLIVGITRELDKKPSLY